MMTSQAIASRSQDLLTQDFYAKEDGPIASPLEYSEPLSRLLRQHVWLKREDLQPSGSFKIRGATSALMALDKSEKSKGVISASSGNHGAATAMAGRRLGIPVKLYVPKNVATAKEEKILALGADLIKVDGGCELAESTAGNTAIEESIVYVSPYNDETVIVGQGTIGIEILEDCPEVSAVFASVGGGGLIAGIGSVMKANKSDCQIIGCWPEHAPVMLKCMEADEVIDVEEQPTLSDGTAGGIEAGAITLPLCKTVIDQSLTVSEEAIADAMLRMRDAHGAEVEGAAGVALAAMYQYASQNAHAAMTQNWVVVICGGNVDSALYDQLQSNRPSGKTTSKV